MAEFARRSVVAKFPCRKQKHKVGRDCGVLYLSEKSLTPAGSLRHHYINHEEFEIS